MNFWAEQRVLITGGAGFIGSHLAQHLVKQGAQVTLLDRHAVPDNPNIQSIAEQVSLLPLDIEHALDTLDISLFDTIFHLGGNPYVPPSVENPMMDYQKNLQTTFKLLECLRNNPNLHLPKPRLIYASSAAVYGNPAKLPLHESDPTFPISPYGVSKLACERYVAVYSQLYGIRGASARMFSVYGARQRKQVVFDLLVKLLNNPHEIEIFGDGKQERDFCHIDDTVNALIMIAQDAPLQGEVYNVASGISHSINQIVMMWCKILNLSPNLRYTGQVRAGEPDKWSVDISALQQLGYAPHITLEDGLRSIKAWYDDNF
jgi:UDP-glucose 4-epimerase